MLEFKKEYFQTENNRHLYPTTLDISKCEVYGCKDREAFMYKIPNNYYSSNAGNIDFSLYPNGVWSDYTGIKIVERLPFFQPSINFNKLGDITPSNLNKLKDEIKKHIVDLETAITESVNFIDSGVPGQNNLPYLPEGCVWFRDPIIKDIIALPISELYGKFNQMIDELRKILLKLLDEDYNDTLLKFLENVKKELERQLSILAGAGSAFKPKQVANIEILKNVNAKVDEVYEVLGYYRFDDGANHKRKIAREDDGSGVQLNNKLWANILEKNIVHTSWFGTKENEDSTQAIQKALDVLPNTKSTIIVDKPTIVGVINVKPYKILTGNKLKVEQISMYQYSNLIDIGLEPNVSLNNKPMILVDRNNMSHMGKCDILIDNIKIYGETQDRDFLLVRNVNEELTGSKGLWALTISNIFGKVQFNTIIKFHCAALKTNQSKSWITYCTIKDIRWHFYKKAIELLTFDIEDGEYGYDTGNRVGVIEAITINNCTFESTENSETFCRLGNGCKNLTITNSWAGDYKHTNTEKYYIFDTRGNYTLTDMRLRYVSPRWIEEKNKYVTYLGEQIEILKNNDVEFQYGQRYKFRDKKDFIINPSSTPGKIVFIAKIPDTIPTNTPIAYILSQAIYNSQSIIDVPTLNIITNTASSLNKKSKVEATTNIATLKKLITFKDNKNNLLIGIESFDNNYLGFVKGQIQAYYNSDYFIFETYDNKEQAIQQGLIFVEEIPLNQRVIYNKPLAYKVTIPAVKTELNGYITVTIPQNLNTSSYSVFINNLSSTTLNAKFYVTNKTTNSFTLNWKSDVSLADKSFELIIKSYEKNEVVIS